MKRSMRAKKTPNRDHHSVCEASRRATWPRDVRVPALLAESQPGNELLVPFQIFFLEISQQAATPADHLEEALTRVVVLLVSAKMFLELRDACGEHGDLDLRRARIGTMGPVGLDDTGLLLTCQGHSSSPLLVGFYEIDSAQTYHLPRGV